MRISNDLKKKRLLPIHFDREEKNKGKKKNLKANRKQKKNNRKYKMSNKRLKEKEEGRRK